MLQPLVGGLTPLGVGRLRGGYASKVLATAPANLLAYWKLDETSGTVAADSSGNGRDGAYSGVDLGGATFVDGSPAPRFNGDGGLVNINSAASAFNGLTGTAMLWLKTSSWADNSFALSLSGAAGNYLWVRKNNPDLRVVYRANGVTKVFDVTTASSDWNHFVLTWDYVADQGKAYWNGAQNGATQNSLGEWAGTPVSIVGAYNPTGSFPFTGNIAQVAFWDTALSAAEALALSLV